MDESLYQAVERLQKEAVTGGMVKAEASGYECGVTSGKWQAFEAVLVLLRKRNEDAEDRDKEL